jgi:NADPH:quinone reductase-like Zn-dependent oxidoreductase
VSLFKKLRVVKGKSIVITGGSGGVGGFAVQLAKLSGLTVYATCSSKNADYVRQLGADDVIDYTANNVVTSVLQRTQGWGVDYWLDTVGSESAATAFEALAFHGELVFISTIRLSRIFHLFFQINFVNIYQQIMNTYIIYLSVFELSGVCCRSSPG